ncbi:putative apoptosis-inducing factor [Hyaloscypha variabilis]
MAAKNIIILGASFSGVNHSCVPNSHFYWNIAVPRALLSGQIPDEKIFQSIADGFKQYPPGQFEFIVASAKSLDVEGKKVGLEILGSASVRTLDYDFLIIATGSSTKEDTPFKTVTSTETTKDRLHALQAELKKAKTIVIAGAGPTGVEIAGELAFEHGQQKKIILLASGPTILENAIPSVSKTATQLLQNLHVEIRLNTKVDGSVQAADGPQTISLSGGKTLSADVYIPTFGVIPNSSYIPNKYVNANGFVIVDDYLKVKGLEDVWAIGDVSDREPPQFMFADKQATYLAKNILLILSKKAPLPYKDGTRGMGLTVGKKAGTGHLGSVKLPGFLVTMLRKNLFLDNLGPTVTGSAF